MTVRHRFRARWLIGALAGGVVATAAAQSPPLLPLPPIPAPTSAPAVPEIIPVSAVSPAIPQVPAIPSIPAPVAVAPAIPAPVAVSPVLPTPPAIPALPPVIIAAPAVPALPPVPAPAKPVALPMLEVSDLPPLVLPDPKPPAKLPAPIAVVPAPLVLPPSTGQVDVPSKVPVIVLSQPKPVLETPKLVVPVIVAKPVVKVEPVAEAPVVPKAIRVTKVEPETDAPVVAKVPTMPPATLPVAPMTEAKASILEAKMSANSVDALASFQMSLTEMKVAYAKVFDYSGHFVRQERVRGKLMPEQTAELRVKAKPRSIAMKFIGPKELLGHELVYVTGRHAEMIRVRPAGNFDAKAFQTVNPTDPRAMVDTRHPITEIGIGAAIDHLEKMTTIERRLRNPMSVSMADFNFVKRPVIRYEIFTERPHALRYAYRTVVYVDKETKLPVRIEAYDQPTVNGAVGGELLEAHSFVNLKFNQGIGEVPFEK